MLEYVLALGWCVVTAKAVLRIAYLVALRCRSDTVPEVTVTWLHTTKDMTRIGTLNSWSITVQRVRDARLSCGSFSPSQRRAT